MFIARQLLTRHKLLAAAVVTAAAMLVGPVAGASAADSHEHTATSAVAKTTVVPKLVGKTAYAAKNAIKKAGLRYSYSPPKGSFVVLSKHWTVTKQSPKAKSKVAAGTKIKLTVVKTSTLGAASKPSAPAAPALSVAQQQAFIAAKGYLESGMGFSRQGLIDQLSSSYGNGFLAADATVVVDALNVDWNAQAVIAAKGYISTGMGFSHKSLLDQLTSPYGNKFTPEQAAFAVAQVGL
jgi:hypothetical protein